MKSLKLIRSLNKAEKKSFEAVIKNKGREPLCNLWKYLLKVKETTLSKEQMFKATYQEKYTKKKDYLLRNELRLLSDELSLFLIRQEFEIALKENSNFRNLQYLKALRKRGLTETLLAEYDKLYNKASKEMQIEIREEMVNERLIALYDLFDRRNVAKEIVESCDQYITALTENVHHQIRIAEFYKAIALRRWHLDPAHKDDLAPNQPAPLFQLDISDPSALSPITQYYYLVAQALASEGTERLHFLEKALVCIGQCNFPGIPQWRLKAGCLNFMGITYSELGMVDEHFDMFKKSLLIQEKHGNTAFTQLFNYLNGLLSYKRIREFWEEMEYYRTWFQSEEELKGLDALIQYGYETEGNYDKALEYLNTYELQTTDDNYLTIKNNLVHIYYRKGMFDLAEHEAENVLHFLWNRDKENLRYRAHTLEFKLIKLLARYKQSVSDEQPAISKKITDLLESNADLVKKIVTTFIRMKWVIEEAERYT